MSAEWSQKQSRSTRKKVANQNRNNSPQSNNRARSQRGRAASQRGRGGRGGSYRSTGRDTPPRRTQVNQRNRDRGRGYYSRGTRGNQRGRGYYPRGRGNRGRGNYQRSSYQNNRGSYYQTNRGRGSYQRGRGYNQRNRGNYQSNRGDTYYSRGRGNYQRGRGGSYYSRGRGTYQRGRGSYYQRDTGRGYTQTWKQRDTKRETRPLQPPTHARKFLNADYFHRNKQNNPIFNNNMLLSKNKCIMLINGYIKCDIYKDIKNQKSNELFRFSDIVNLIEKYYNRNIFIWKLNKRVLNEMKHYSVSEPCTIPLTLAPNKEWAFSFDLVLYPRSKPKQRSRLRSRYTGNNQPKDNSNFADFELNINPGDNIGYRNRYRRGISTGRGQLLPPFIKIYYELYCDEIEKISFWKGTQKYRSVNFQEGKGTFRDNLLIPRGYVERAELLKNNKLNIKLAVRFLCAEWYGFDHYFANIVMCRNVKFRWNITNNYAILDSFRSKKESIIFSRNFDSDNWCLYCKNIQTPTDKKKKKKFYVGLMLINLPWFFNYVKIQLIVKCNDKNNTKDIKKNIWPGFESSLKIPFKYDILKDSESLNITVMFKILKVFDKQDKEIHVKDKRFWSLVKS